VCDLEPREKPRGFFFMAMDGRYAGNAGAISGKWPWMAGMPKTQEQYPANGRGWTVCGELALTPQPAGNFNNSGT
jgi:hypothetical protein